MNTAQITKTLNKVSNQPSNYSIGFRRLSSLPQRVRKNINTACILNGESNTNSVKELLNGMSETEFVNWLKFM